MPSRLRSVDAVCDAVWNRLERLGLAEQAFKLVLGLREALVNAVLHGNGRGAEERVTCELLLDGDRLEVLVADSGEGFDWRRERERPEPLSESGRGLHILRHCYDEVVFNEKGNEVRFSKRGLQPREEEMSEIMREENGVVVRPGRDLVASTVEDLRAELGDLVDEGTDSLTIDFEGVDMVDSLGMGLLVATHNSLKKNEGKLELVNVPESIHEVLSIMRLTRHFEVRRTGEEG
ncbi:ATP-binding protein [Desulfohalovibrio reitneri]|uniref:ATP-binding protein n=1 Tax=Desulfohalovibrio reitneri TaxID=1307759 RepID=UPI001F3D2CDF|nr:ATP-binding protein [Desulfohalovibrio reitneri]